MIRRNLLKVFTLGLCMTALFARAAYARSGEGTSSAYEGTISAGDSVLYEKQKEMDQYLFVDHVKEIDKMGFSVIYTGVADRYVEVGITPYSEKNAKYLYSVFGEELVKVVDGEETSTYTNPEEAKDSVMPKAPDNPDSPLTDMGGDTPVSDTNVDEEIKERELITNKEDELSTQIEYAEGNEQAQDMGPEVIWQTGISGDVSKTDTIEADLGEDAETRFVSAKDDTVQVTSANDIENKDKGLPTASVIAVVAGGIIIIGGVAFVSSKKKAVKNNK